jgi:hypothetical protein
LRRQRTASLALYVWFLFTVLLALYCMYGAM